MREGTTWEADDTSKRDAVIAQIRRDIEAGKLDRLTFKIARSAPYSLTADNDIHIARRQLRDSGHLIKVKNRYLVPDSKVAA